jgi:hypothetical protein
MGTAIVRPTNESLNPCDFSHHTLWDPGWVVYVLWKTSDARSRPTRVITSHGPVPGWKVGEKLYVQHDEGRYLGDYEIVGITYASSSAGRSVGSIPSLKIKHSVVK